MSTKYTLNVLARCPLDLIQDANQFARLLGPGSNDDITFTRAPFYHDPNRKTYKVSFFPAIESFPFMATSNLQQLATSRFGEGQTTVDVQAAQRAQQRLVIATNVFDPETRQWHFTPEPTDSDFLAVVHPNYKDVLQWLNLSYGDI